MVDGLISVLYSERQVNMAGQYEPPADLIVATGPAIFLDHQAVAVKTTGQSRRSLRVITIIYGMLHIPGCILTRLDKPPVDIVTRCTARRITPGDQVAIDVPIRHIGFDAGVSPAIGNCEPPVRTLQNTIPTHLPGVNIIVTGTRITILLNDQVIVRASNYCGRTLII